MVYHVILLSYLTIILDVYTPLRNKIGYYTDVYNTRT